MSAESGGRCGEAVIEPDSVSPVNTQRGVSMDFTSGLESRSGAAPSSSYIIRSVERSQPAERPSTILQGSRCFFITINPDRAVITIPDVYQSNEVIPVINAFSS